MMVLQESRRSIMIYAGPSLPSAGLTCGKGRGKPGRTRGMSRSSTKASSAGRRPGSRSTARLRPPPGPAHPPQRRLTGLQFRHPPRHGALPDSGRTSDEPDAPMTQRPCLCSYDQPPLPLVEMREQCPELRGQCCLDPLWTPHSTTTIHRAGSDGLFPGKP